jgi:hypothetical protein
VCRSVFLHRLPTEAVFLACCQSEFEAGARLLRHLNDAVAILSLFMMDSAEEGWSCVLSTRRSGGARHTVFAGPAAPSVWRSCPAAGLLARSHWL